MNRNNKEPLYSLAYTNKAGTHIIIDLPKGNQLPLSDLNAFTRQFKSQEEMQKFLVDGGFLMGSELGSTTKFVLLDELGMETPEIAVSYIIPESSIPALQQRGLALRIKGSGEYKMISFVNSTTGLELTPPLFEGKPSVATLDALARFTRRFPNHQSLILELNHLGYFRDTGIPIDAVDDIVFLTPKCMEIDFEVPYGESSYHGKVNTNGHFRRRKFPTSRGPKDYYK